jgi:signal transduction histidine kinase/HAMP domain-containing protein
VIARPFARVYPWRMPLRIGMRWWLAVAFAVIAAVTAVAVAQVFSERSERAFRERAQDLAAGQAFQVAIEIAEASGDGALRWQVDAAAVRSGLALFVFDEHGRLLTASRSRGINLEAVPQRTPALKAALDGRRFAATEDGIDATVVSLPLRVRGSAALLAYARHPDLAAELGIVRDEIAEAALFAVVLGALVGVLVATLIAARLRRIRTAAAAIEAGEFDTPLPVRLRDEVGELAGTISRMGRRLGESFSRLESERDRLGRLLERLHQGVLTVDSALRVEFANSEARWLLGEDGLKEGDELPEPWRAFSLRDFTKALFETDAPVSEASVEPDEERSYTLVGIPPKSRNQSAVLVITDVSARERAERAEREFVANAAHELRTPLTTIRGAVEALQTGAEDEPRQRKRFLEHIDRESSRLVRLVQSLLVLARAQTKQGAVEGERVELRGLLEEAVASVRPNPDVEMSIDCPPGLEIATDRGLAEQAFFNLVQNAAKHTQQGSIAVSATAHDGAVHVAVADTGPGIAPEERARVFDRFYRSGARDSEGFGLGLAIVLQAVRAMNGAVEIESAPGVGTTAHVTLPRAGGKP